jgi:hypothetical protein
MAAGKTRMCIFQIRELSLSDPLRLIHNICPIILHFGLHFGRACVCSRINEDHTKPDMAIPVVSEALGEMTKICTIATFSSLPLITQTRNGNSISCPPNLSVRF